MKSETLRNTESTLLVLYAIAEKGACAPAQGKSLDQAIADANSSIHVKKLFDTPIPQGLNWMAIGDSSLKLRRKQQ
jgi:hypothetical protein